MSNIKKINVPVSIDTTYIQKKISDEAVDELINQLCDEFRQKIEDKLLHEKDFNGASKLRQYTNSAVKDIIDENKDYIIEESIKRVSSQIIRDKKYVTQVKEMS